MLSLRMVLILSCFASLPSAGWSADVASETGSAPNLLLITLDTTRADHIGSYGYPLPTSPNLDRLAATGVRFDTVVAQIPLTGPSHATILTGLYPHEHGAVRNGVPLPDSVETLTERLQQVGYRTAAFLSGWTLRANLSGLAQGFDQYDDRMEDRYNVVNSQRLSNQVTPLAVDWLREHAGGDRPFFLWVHYFDAHAPYTKRDRLYDDLGGKPDGIPSRTMKYDSEIRFADDGIGQVLAALEKAGQTRNTLIVVTADHGESLGEHGYVGHGQYLYEEILLVPMVMTWPGQIDKGVVEAPVALLDVTPTLLHLLGVSPLARTEGINLVPLMKGASGASYETRQIRFELYPGARKSFFKFFSPPVTRTPTMVGFRQGDLKLVHHLKLGFTSVYDLSGDDGEDRDLFEQYPGMKASAEQLLAWIESTTVGLPDSEMSAEDRKKLESLGYND